MALNPQLALQAGQGITPFDPMGAAQKGLTLVDLMTQVQMRPELLRQQLATARAAEQQTQATTAGQLLLNQQAARENAARLRLAEIAKENSKVDATTGKISLDHSAIASKAASEGLDPGSVFAYMQRGAETAQANIKTAEDKKKYATDYLSTMNNLIRVQTDPVRAHQMSAEMTKTLANVVGAEDAASYIKKYFNLGDAPPVDPVTGQPDPKQIGQQLITQSRINSQSTITPLEAEDLKLRQAAQALAELQVSPEYRERVSTIQSPEQRAASMLAAAEIETFINTNNEGIRAAQSLNKLDTRPGAIVSSVWNRIVSQDPAARQLQASIEAYNIRNKTNLSIEDGIAAVVQTLAQENRVLGVKSATNRALATGGNVREAGATAPPAPRTEPPRATGRAPQRALDLLKSNPTPEMKQAFRQKYGFLPEGM